MIFLLKLKGHSHEEIAKMYGVHKSTIRKHYINELSSRMNVPVFVGNKAEPYYKNEDDYGNLPQYDYSQLSSVEKKIYKTGENSG